jgi:rhodanese-related sulfurtransferase
MPQTEERHSKKQQTTKEQRMKTILCGIMAVASAFSTTMATAQGTGAKDESVGVGMASRDSEAKIVVPDISLVDLKQVIADKSVTLLDCNGSKSYANGHIPGAIDFEGCKTNLTKRLPTDKAALVVAYCGGPKCLAYQTGAAAATKLGYTNVKHFAGGISGWKDAGEKCETAALCPTCGQILGSDVCCKADAPKCDKCGMAQGSPGCCMEAKAK